LPNVMIEMDQAYIQNLKVEWCGIYTLGFAPKLSVIECLWVVYGT
jgi:hypothetical protein